MNSLKEKYIKEIIPELEKKHNYTNGHNNGNNYTRYCGLTSSSFL